MLPLASESLSSRLLSNNTKSEIYKVIIFLFYVGMVNVFENNVLRRKFDRNNGKMVGIDNEEFHNLYSSPNIVRMLK
jgi:hypothetical protein